jgi:hypothetical protein
MVKLSQKYNVGVVKTWVGFSMLAKATQDLWSQDEDIYNTYLRIHEGTMNEKLSISHLIVCDTYDLDKSRRSANIAAMEQSNGFSIL